MALGHCSSTPTCTTTIDCTNLHLHSFRCIHHFDILDLLDRPKETHTCKLIRVKFSKSNCFHSLRIRYSTMIVSLKAKTYHAYLIFMTGCIATLISNPLACSSALLQFSAVRDNNLLARFTARRSDCLDSFHNFHAIDDTAEYDMFAIQPSCLGRAKEELRAIAKYMEQNIICTKQGEKAQYSMF